jgi:hypothetical protein
MDDDELNEETAILDVRMCRNREKSPKSHRVERESIRSIRFRKERLILRIMTSLNNVASTQIFSGNLNPPQLQRNGPIEAQYFCFISVGLLKNSSSVFLIYICETIKGRASIKNRNLG